MDAIPPGTDLSKIPLGINPDGSPPDFGGGESLSRVVLILGIVLMVTSVVFVTIRLYTSFKHIGRIWLDDWFCLAAEACVIIYWAIFYTLAEHGLGKHAWDIPASFITPWMLKRHVVSQFIGAAGVWFSKAAILGFFLRLFGSLRWVRVTCYGMFAFVSATAIVNMGLFAGLCIPRRFQKWDALMMAECAKTAPGIVAVGVCVLVIDIIMFVMPFPIIATLQMNKHKKRGLAIVFLVGFLIVVTSVVGVAYRIVVITNGTDPTWNGSNVSIAAYMDTWGTIIVSCTPSISSWWINIMPRTRLYTSIASMMGSSSRRTSTATSRQSKPDSYHPQSPYHETKSAPSSTGDVWKDNVPMNHIQKSIVITQTRSTRKGPSDGEPSLVEQWRREVDRMKCPGDKV